MNANPRRTQLLVSVRNATEALAALEGGADIIDVKEPRRGSLGMATPQTMQAVVDAVAGRCPVSVALGEFLENPPILQVPREVAFVKMGLAGLADAKGWGQPLSVKLAGAPRARPVAVIYADAEARGVSVPPIEDVIRWANDHAAGVLIDTIGKDGRGLFNTALGADLLANGVSAFRRRWTVQPRLFIALAGSLFGEALDQAIGLAPEIVAVRGAACVGRERWGAIDGNRVRDIADLIAAHNAQTAATAG